MLAFPQKTLLGWIYTSDSILLTLALTHNLTVGELASDCRKLMLIKKNFQESWSLQPTSIIGLNFVTIVKLSNHLQSSFGIVIPPNAAERRKLMKTNELCILNSLLNVEILHRKYFYHLKSFFIYNIWRI